MAALERPGPLAIQAALVALACPGRLAAQAALACLAPWPSRPPWPPSHALAALVRPGRARAPTTNERRENRDKAGVQRTGTWVTMMGTWGHGDSPCRTQGHGDLLAVHLPAMRPPCSHASSRALCPHVPVLRPATAAKDRCWAAAARKGWSASSAGMGAAAVGSCSRLGLGAHGACGRPHGSQLQLHAVEHLEEACHLRVAELRVQARCRRLGSALIAVQAEPSASSLVSLSLLSAVGAAAALGGLGHEAGLHSSR